MAHGQRIDILLEARNCSIDEAEQSLTWHGEASSCQFLLAIPREIAGRTCPITARILVDSVPAGKLRFTLNVDAGKPTGASDLVGEIAQRYRLAFLSHSHEDRVRVFAFAQLLEALGVSYFQDIASIRLMEHWERRLHEAIDTCDLFLLFWSASAAQSVWVEREARYALARQSANESDEPDVMPIFLDPESPSPPNWLKGRQFDSVARLAMLGAHAERRSKL